MPILSHYMLTHSKCPNYPPTCWHTSFRGIGNEFYTHAYPVGNSQSKLHRYSIPRIRVQACVHSYSFLYRVSYNQSYPPQKKQQQQQQKTQNPTQPTAIIAEEEVNVTLLRNRYLKLPHLQYLIQWTEGYFSFSLQLCLQREMFGE